MPIANQHDAIHIQTTGRRWIPCALVCSFLLVIGTWGLGVGLIDDAYIFLRYARNLAEGHGPVFNVGERVEGYSSPMWVLVLGILGTVSADFERLAYGCGLLCGVGVLAGTIRGLRIAAPNLDAVSILVIGIGLATSPILFFASGSGMDSALFGFLVIASLVSVLEDQEAERISTRTAILLAVAIFARTEGVMLAGYALLVCRRKRRVVATMLGLGVWVAALLVMRWMYYGTWVPNTAYAKVAFDFDHRLRNGFEYLGRGIRVGWPVVVVAFGCFAAAWRMRRRNTGISFRGIGVLLGWVGIYSGYVLYVGGDNLPGLRFLLPVVAALFLLMGCLYSTVGDRLSTQKKFAVHVVVLLAVAATNVLTYRATSKGYRGDMKLAQAWSNVCRWIDRETPKDVVIATPVPGAMGYFGKRTTIDMLGLTDAVVAQQGRVFTGGAHGHARYHTDYIFDRDPDLMIHMSSGRSKTPLYTSPEKIFRWTGYAVYDFASDPRCSERYEFATAALDDGTLVEMLRRRADHAASARQNATQSPNALALTSSNH